MIVGALIGVFDAPPTNLAMPVSYLTPVLGAVIVAVTRGVRRTRRPTAETLRDL